MDDQVVLTADVLATLEGLSRTTGGTARHLQGRAAYSYGLNHFGKQISSLVYINILRQRQNGRHFADYTFKGIFWNENVRISIKISLKFVPKSPINNIPALVQIMA